MRNTSHPNARRRGLAHGARLVVLVASLATVVALVQLPCSMGAEACALASIPGTNAMVHCPMTNANGGREMACCAKGEGSRQSSPATPAGSDSGARLQLQALPFGVSTAPGLTTPPEPTEGPATARLESPAASATPLYTLLSTLLS